jgi:hypothetical protein
MYGPSFGRDLEVILTVLFTFAVLGFVLTPIFIPYKTINTFKSFFQNSSLVLIGLLHR